MAILALTDQPARVRRIAAELRMDVTIAADVTQLDEHLRALPHAVLIDDDLAGDTSALTARIAGSGSAPIVMFREATLADTLNVLRAGAVDIVGLPVDVERIRRTVGTGAVISPSWEDARVQSAPHEWIGSSAAMLDVFRLGARAALSEAHVLIVGEAGVGKRLLARVIHEHSGRARSPFVGISCVALESRLLAVELFGQDDASGAHTGAVAGQAARAAGGTLFLDDVAALRPPLQQRLAKALRERVYAPLGSFQQRPFEARVIATGRSDLRAAAEAGEFDADLLYEFGVEIAIPPLRRRTEDIPVLAAYFLSHFARHYGKVALRGFAADALEALERYDWPGNVQQLRNVVERAVAASSNAAIHVQDLAPEVTGTRQQLQDADAGSVALEAVERRHIRQIWRITGGHLSETADLLGIHRNTLRRKLEQYGITEEDART